MNVRKDMSSALRWYVLLTPQGAEAKAMNSIKESMARENMGDIADCFIPEADKPTRASSRSLIFSSYVFVKVEMTRALVDLIRRVDNVRLLLQRGSDEPVVLSESDVDAVRNKIESEKSELASVAFLVGDIVKVTELGCEGVVELVDKETETLSVLLSIFGRPTPMKNIKFKDVELVKREV